eukprot:m.207198 g.207198  ORF g.207198 m.207198 type:complete len:324 (+) comp15027_c2_seq40:756-1727(+)
MLNFLAFFGEFVNLFHGQTPKRHTQQVVVICGRPSACLTICIVLVILRACPAFGLVLWEGGIALLLKVGNYLGFPAVADDHCSTHNLLDKANAVVKLAIVVGQSIGQQILSLLVQTKALMVKLLQNFQLTVVLVNATLPIKQSHVGCGNASVQLEELLKSLGLGSCHLLWCHGYNKANCCVSMMLGKVRDLSRMLCIIDQETFQKFFVRLRPRSDGKLSNLKRRLVKLFDSSSHKVLALGLFGDFTRKSPVPRHHFFWFSPFQHAFNVGNDIARIVVWYRCTPTGPNTVATVDEDHWQNGNIKFLNKTAQKEAACQLEMQSIK